MAETKQFVFGGIKSDEVLLVGRAMPKAVARVKLCGVSFTIYDNMGYEVPTKEQRENLKKVFGIDVEVMEDA